MATYRITGFTDVDHVLTVEPAGSDGRGRERWAYELAADDAVIFTGCDLSTPSGTSEDKAAVAALFFLTLRPDDVESDYFDDYGPKQRDWRDCHAEELSLALCDDDGDELDTLARYRTDDVEISDAATPWCNPVA